MNGYFPAGWAEAEAERIVRQVTAERAGRPRVPAYVPQPDVTRVDLPAVRDDSQCPAAVLRFTPPPRPAPAGEVSAALVARIPYPSLPVDPRRYPAYLRRVGKVTGTCTAWESDDAWRLAIEMGDQS